MKKSNLYLFTGLILLVVLIAAVGWLPKSLRQTGKATIAAPAKKKIIFIAGRCSHGPGEHEHQAGSMLLASELNKHMGKEVEAQVFQGWPTDSTILENASTIVMYMDGGGGHLALQHMNHVTALTKKGIGLVCLHYAVEVPKERGGPEFKNWLGGYFEPYWSVNPHWDADFKTLPKHPVTSGVQPFTLNDEWYYHMRFLDGMKGVTPILTAIPPASTLERKDGPHEGNEFVRKKAGQPQHTAWAVERPDKGRGFGFTGGHFHKNWGNENFRKLVLNAILWTAKIAVPKQGVTTPALSTADLQANLDAKPCNRSTNANP
ncbi:MAG: ThuA domain-containing protein [Chitinophagaceae bacterium]